MDHERSTEPKRTARTRPGEIAGPFVLLVELGRRRIEAPLFVLVIWCDGSGWAQWAGSARTVAGATVGSADSGATDTALRRFVRCGTRKNRNTSPRGAIQGFAGSVAARSADRHERSLLGNSDTRVAAEPEIQAQTDAEKRR